MIHFAFKVFLKQITFYIFPVLTGGWVLTPFSTHFFGAAIGILVSVYCMWVLGRRINKIEERIVAGKRMPSLGFLNRSAAAVLGAIILYELEHQMVMEAFAAGILGGYFLMTINLGYYSMQEANGKKF
ncbi:ATP synthase subunit I [Peribacillus saganii]|uniref:ATP synthase subunit I n=1 Tax=Peribacillus saganii TaxID=2303992 RepID=A0A372LTS9_9BACI|nr:ATP synthase subunit I [Peribacillus saganii]RFU71210.1 ATP synthase subunit I [Peribacillus saganii]